MGDYVLNAYKRRLLDVIRTIDETLYKELAFLDQMELAVAKEKISKKKED